MFCKQCSAENMPNSKFCTTCGSKLHTIKEKQSVTILNKISEIDLKKLKIQLAKGEITPVEFQEKLKLIKSGKMNAVITSKKEKQSVTILNKISEIDLKKLKIQLAKGEITPVEFQEKQQQYSSKIKKNKVHFESLLKKGMELFNHGQHKEATKYFDKALSIEPKKINLLILKGKSLYYLNKFKSSISYFDEVLKLEPNNIEVLEYKGQVLSRIKRYDEALLIFDVTLGINSKNPSVWIEKGDTIMKKVLHQKTPQHPRLRTAFQSGQSAKFKEAITCFDKALKFNSNNIDALNRKGDAYCLLETLGENKGWSFRDGIKCYDKVLKIEPENRIALNNKGDAYLNTKYGGWYKTAITCFDKILRKNPDDVIVLCNKGRALSLKGKIKDSLPYFDKALSIEPNNLRALELKKIALSKH
ncbi:tetratricopeptide repeat protein [Nitrosopumilus ureiphilus]|nr:tetratricopeptide repeat protein [Nitrosopumilus ureiphilus]